MAVSSEWLTGHNDPGTDLNLLEIPDFNSRYCFRVSSLMGRMAQDLVAATITIDVRRAASFSR